MLVGKEYETQLSGVISFISVILQGRFPQFNSMVGCFRGRGCSLQASLHAGDECFAQCSDGFGCGPTWSFVKTACANLFLMFIAGQG